jgi:membrane associated rhomboid family serine protease
MGIYDREYYRNEGPSLFNTIIPDGRVCRWLIGLNLLLFLLQLVFRRSVEDLGPVTSWLYLDTAAVFHGEVWRLLTYAFVHDPDDFTHILFNMLFLWWFGTDLEEIYGPREFLGFYLVSAVLGGAAFQAWALAKGQPMFCLGASGAVTAVLILCACHFPQRMILVMLLIPVPIWLFAVFEVSQDVYRVLRSTDPRFSSPVASIVHLAGAAFGFVYYKQQWRVLSWWPDLKQRWKRRGRPNLRVYRPQDDKEPVSVAAATPGGDMDEHLEAKLDAVLEKVSRHGQESLTENERSILLRASEIYKRRRT